MKSRPPHLGILFSVLFGLAPYVVKAGCSVHDHNCFHGSYPLNPIMGNIPSGPATLNVTTTYGGVPDIDINQHVALPEHRGPFIASNPDGNPVEATPLGGGANVIYHAQQNVQYAAGSAGGVLTSAPGSESTSMRDNVAEGTYAVAVYNYDIYDLGLDGSYATVVTAGGTGHFDGPSQSHVATPFVQSISLGGGTLGANQASGATSFKYYNNGFNPHAQGVYVIPDGVWNFGGADIAANVMQAYQFKFENRDLTQDQVAIDFLSHIQPEATEANYEYGGWLYQKENGQWMTTLSVGEEDSVTLYRPIDTMYNDADTVAMFHTHQRSNDLAFSTQDIHVARQHGVDSYLVNGQGMLGVVRNDPIYPSRNPNGPVELQIQTSHDSGFDWGEVASDSAKGGAAGATLGSRAGPLGALKGGVDGAIGGAAISIADQLSEADQIQPEHISVDPSTYNNPANNYGASSPSFGEESDSSSSDDGYGGATASGDMGDGFRG